MENNYQSWLWEKLGEKCVKNLKKHGFDAHFAATKEDAKKLILDMVFRPALFKALTGLKEGDILNPKGLVRAFDGKAGLFKNTPASARRIVFLNQLDIFPDDRAAQDMARRLIETHRFIERVVLGSFRKNEFISIHQEGV